MRRIILLLATLALATPVALAQTGWPEKIALPLLSSALARTITDADFDVPTEQRVPGARA